MKTILQLLVVLIAVVLGGIGVTWLVSPSTAAPEFGLSLPEGPGLSTLVADMGSFMLTISAAILGALISGRRVLYYAPIMLLATAALGRVVAWAAHGAPFVVHMVAAEVVMAGVLLAASRQLASKG